MCHTDQIGTNLGRDRPPYSIWKHRVGQNFQTNATLLKLCFCLLGGLVSDFNSPITLYLHLSLGGLALPYRIVLCVISVVSCVTLLYSKANYMNI